MCLKVGDHIHGSLAAALLDLVMVPRNVVRELERYLLRIGRNAICDNLIRVQNHGS